MSFFKKKIIDMTVLEERVWYVWNANTDTVRTCCFHPQLVIQVLKFQKKQKRGQSDGSAGKCVQHSSLTP